MSSKVCVTLVSSVMDVVYRLSMGRAGGVWTATHQSISAHHVTTVISIACDTDLYGLQFQKHKSEHQMSNILDYFLFISVASFIHYLTIISLKEHVIFSMLSLVIVLGIFVAWVEPIRLCGPYISLFDNCGSRQLPVATQDIFKHTIFHYQQFWICNRSSVGVVFTPL